MCDALLDVPARWLYLRLILVPGNKLGIQQIEKLLQQILMKADSRMDVVITNVQNS